MLVLNSDAIQIKLDVSVWTTNDNNVFTSKFTYGLSSSIATGNKIVISWKRPNNGGLYFKHQGGSSPVSSPNIQKYKIYLQQITYQKLPQTNIICTIIKIEIAEIIIML